MTTSFQTRVEIKAQPAEVWKTLTHPERMMLWMGEPEMNIEIHTDWKLNGPILVRGFHHTAFENKGMVVTFEPEKRVSYTHLSSLSRLADKPENYSLLEFDITAVGHHTQLALTINNFPTEAIRKHLEFYWRTTLLSIKNTLEKQTA